MSIYDIASSFRLPRPVADPVVLLFLGVIGIVTASDAPQTWVSLRYTGWALAEIAPFIVISVVFAAFARASEFDRLVARAFSSRSAMAAIVLAALFGALSPFCSCGVVPIIAGLLAAGVPLAPVMAFWLASPLMDPEMLILMLPVFGVTFTAAKVASAIAIGTTAGLATHLATRAGLFRVILRDGIATSQTCAAEGTLRSTSVKWIFWHDHARRRAFASTSVTMTLFLAKWLALAFFLESLMLAYVPANAMAEFLSGNNLLAVPTAVAIGIPAYLNGYAAIPLVAGLMELGMPSGAALAFMLAGGITSLPASMAVFSLVRPAVFASYLVTGWCGALAAGYVFQFV